MKKAGATPAAVEFSKQLGEPGFVRDFRAAGPVDIAYVLYPYRANENQSWLIVNGDPPAIDVDNSKLVTVAARALKNNATYAGLAKAHPTFPRGRVTAIRRRLPTWKWARRAACISL